MKPEEFWDKVKDLVTQFLGYNPVGVDFFVSDMEELFEEWEEKSQHLERKL